jgi:hypothetical protein
VSGKTVERDAMNRRMLLLGSAGVVGAGVVGYGGIFGAGALRRCAGDDAHAALSQRKALVRLGTKYLAQAPALERAELREIAQGPVAVVLESAALMTGQAQQDFETGNVISCDGWVLARGEARSCALVALVLA